MKYLIACIAIMILGLYEIDSVDLLTGNYLNQKPPGNIPEIFAPGIISTGSHETDVTIFPDLSEIYFTRTGANWFSTIYVVKFDGEQWLDPMKISFTGEQSINYPFVSPDGKYIYFDTQGKSGAPADRDIWVAERKDNDWGTPHPLDAIISSPSIETFASVSTNGNLYYTSRRDGGVGEADIYFARKLKDGYVPTENLGVAINSKYNEFHPFIDPGERFIIFDSQKPGGFGGNDLYICFKDENGNWTNAVNMGSTINTSSLEMRPYVSPDGKYLFFCSNRMISQNTEKAFDNNSTSSAGLGSQDIYWVDAKVIENLKPQ